MDSLKRIVNLMTNEDFNISASASVLFEVTLILLITLSQEIFIYPRSEDSIFYSFTKQHTEDIIDIFEPFKQKNYFATRESLRI